jgi:rubrerythrin
MADISKNGASETEEEINITDALKKDYESESADHDKYEKLAMAADKQYPCRGYGAILRDIAREEEVHRRHIRMILEDMHATMEE